MSYEEDKLCGYCLTKAAKKNRCSSSQLQNYFVFGRNPSRRKREYPIKFKGNRGGT